MCVNIVLAKCLAKVDYILFEWYLKISKKRMFPAIIGEETVELDSDVSPQYEGNKGNDYHRGSV